MNFRALLAAPILLLAGQQAQAATATSTMPVTATVPSTCTTIATQSTLAFGSVAQNTADIDASQTISFTCTATTPYFISIAAGTNASGPQNRLKGTGATFINYNIFSDAARSVAFPTAVGTLGTAPTGGTGTGTAATVTVFGRIPLGQALPAPGAYTDSLPITITY